MPDYNKPQLSPYQFKRKMPNIQNEKHPVQEFIRQNLGTYTLTATFMPDLSTIEKLKIPGAAGFLCLLKCGNQVLAEGRSLTIISEANKWYEKSLIYAKGQALLDAIAKGSKILDILPLDANPQQDIKTTTSYNCEDKEIEDGITDKQANFLTRLLRDNQASENEIESVYQLSKKEAMRKIKILAPTR